MWWHKFWCFIGFHYYTPVGGKFGYVELECEFCGEEKVEDWG